MQNKVEELQNVLTKAVEKALDIDVGDDVEIDDFIEDFESAFCDVVIDGQDFEFSLSKCGENCTYDGGKYKLIVTCGRCNDVEGANMELAGYDESEIGEVLYVEDAIEEPGDALLLSAEFNAEDDEDATEVLADILSYLVDEEKSEPLTELLQYFSE